VTGFLQDTREKGDSYDHGGGAAGYDTNDNERGFYVCNAIFVNGA